VRDRGRFGGNLAHEDDVVHLVGAAQREDVGRQLIAADQNKRGHVKLAPADR
jgi:hypothetical protein